MKIIAGNIWDKWEEGYYIGITTNCELNKKGEAIMGAGIAKEAKKRIPSLPFELGHYKEDLSTVTVWNKHKIITIPTKYEWRKPSDVNLIIKSCHDLSFLMSIIQEEVYLPQLGCSNGQLKWKDVKPLMEEYLVDERFIVMK
jgi:hypothetical protein|tara:strand:- start:4 stop:429 length:426 start_codon:yes stop_codon:yes gene_type:complete